MGMRAPDTRGEMLMDTQKIKLAISAAHVAGAVEIRLPSTHEAVEAIRTIGGTVDKTTYLYGDGTPPRTIFAARHEDGIWPNAVAVVAQYGRPASADEAEHAKQAGKADSRTYTFASVPA
jgi:hypothetical protein